MNKQQLNTVPVEPATFLDLEEPITDAFYMSGIACDLLQDALCYGRGEIVNGGSDYKFVLGKEEIEKVEFASIQTLAIARDLRRQFYAIYSTKPQPTQCSNDPLLALVRTYEAGLAAYNAAPDPVGEEAERALVASTYGPSFAALTNGCVPQATTRAGALAALRMVQAELRHSGGDGQMATSILSVVLPFLEQEAA